MGVICIGSCITAKDVAGCGVQVSYINITPQCNAMLKKKKKDCIHTYQPMEWHFLVITN